MQMRPQLQIQAIIKAMTQDVIPALDQTNQLAMQSAQLTVGTLALIAQHLPLEYRFDCDELSRLSAAAAALLAQMQGEPKLRDAAAVLESADKLGVDVLQRARAEPAQIVDAVRALRSATAQAVRTAHIAGSELMRNEIRRIVLDMSKNQLLRDRSWLLLQGWEPDPAAVPRIEALLEARTQEL
jgi:hypothetical protein